MILPPKQILSIKRNSTFLYQQLLHSQINNSINEQSVCGLFHNICGKALYKIRDLKYFDIVNTKYAFDVIFWVEVHCDDTDSLPKVPRYLSYHNAPEKTVNCGRVDGNSCFIHQKHYQNFRFVCNEKHFIHIEFYTPPFCAIAGYGTYHDESIQQKILDKSVAALLINNYHNIPTLVSIDINAKIGSVLGYGSTNALGNNLINLFRKYDLVVFNDKSITYFNPKLNKKPQILDQVFGPRWISYHYDIAFFVLPYMFDSDHYPIGYKITTKNVCYPHLRDYLYHHQENHTLNFLWHPEIYTEFDYCHPNFEVWLDAVVIQHEKWIQRLLRAQKIVYYPKFRKVLDSLLVKYAVKYQILKKRKTFQNSQLRPQRLDHIFDTAYIKDVSNLLQTLTALHTKLTTVRVITEPNIIPFFDFLNQQLNNLIRKQYLLDELKLGRKLLWYNEYAPNSAKFYRMLKRANYSSPTVTSNSNSSTAQSIMYTALTARDHFRNLYRFRTPKLCHLSYEYEQSFLFDTTPIGKLQCIPPTPYELRKTFQRLNEDANEAFDITTILMLKYMLHRHMRYVHFWFGLIWQSEFLVPYEMLQRLIALPKPKGGFRGISVSSVIFKFLSALLYYRIQDKLNKYMANTQFAAKTGIGLSDAIFTSTHAITSNYITLDQPTNEISFDQEKAFDYSAITSLFYQLYHDFDINGKYWRMLWHCAICPLTSVVTLGYLTDPIHRYNGVKQGCPLSAPTHNVSQQFRHKLAVNPDCGVITYTITPQNLPKILQHRHPTKLSPLLTLPSHPISISNQTNTNSPTNHINEVNETNDRLQNLHNNNDKNTCHTTNNIYTIPHILSNATTDCPLLAQSPFYGYYPTIPYQLYHQLNRQLLALHAFCIHQHTSMIAFDPQHNLSDIFRVHHHLVYPWLYQLSPTDTTDNLHRHYKYYLTIQQQIQQIYHDHRFISVCKAQPFSSCYHSTHKFILNYCQVIKIAEITYMDDSLFLNNNPAEGQKLVFNLDSGNSAMCSSINSGKSNAILFYDTLLKTTSRLICHIGLMTNNGIIHYQKVIRYLGFLFTTNLNFTQHVTQINKRVTATASQLTNRLHNLFVHNPQITVSLYHSHIRSIVESKTTAIFLKPKLIDRVYNHYFQQFKRSIKISSKCNTLLLSIYFGMPPGLYRYNLQKCMLFYDLLSRNHSRSIAKSCLIQQMINVKNYLDAAPKDKLQWIKVFPKFEQLPAYTFWSILNDLKVPLSFHPDIFRRYSRSQWKCIIVNQLKKYFHQKIMQIVNYHHISGHILVHKVLTHNKVLLNDSQSLYNTNIIYLINNWCRQNHLRYDDLHLHPQFWNILLLQHPLYWRHRSLRVYPQCILCNIPWNDPWHHLFKSCPKLNQCYEYCQSHDICVVNIFNHVDARTKFVYKNGDTLLNNMQSDIDELIMLSSKNKNSGTTFSICNWNISQINYIIWFIYNKYDLQTIISKNTYNISNTVNQIPNLLTSDSNNMFSVIQNQGQYENFIQSISKNSIVVFTDGSALNNPGPAGAAAYLITTGKQQHTHISCDLGFATNNQAELFAIWLACKLVYQLLQTTVGDTCSIIHICTDSLYVLRILSQNQPVSRNVRQIVWLRKELNKWQHRNKHICWHLVKGHGNIVYNTKVDELAVQSAKKSKIWLQKQRNCRSKKLSLQQRPALPIFPSKW